MKTNSTGKNNSSKPQINLPKRPENKDNLDSREGEEQSDKGRNTTHNKKENHNEQKRNKNN